MRSCGNGPDSARRAASVTNEASQPAAEKLPLNPFERRAALDAAHRLKPDRRILLAVEAVQRFFVAGSPASATAVQEGERWRIRLGPADVGTLRDLQDFQQALSLVEAFARQLAGEHPATARAAAAEASPGPRFDWEPEAIVSHRDAQARWIKGEHYPELARRACRSLASLAFQEVDTLGVGDRLPAQALAMLGSRALGAKATREEALTAAALGYTAAAQAAAMRLPQSDELRLFLEGSSRLECSAAGASLAARYLQLRMLRWADDEKGEERWLKSQLSDEQHRLPVLALPLRSRHGWRSAVARPGRKATPRVTEAALSDL